MSGSGASLRFSSSLVVTTSPYYISCFKFRGEMVKKKDDVNVDNDKENKKRIIRTILLKPVAATTTTITQIFVVILKKKKLDDSLLKDRKSVV